MDGERLLNEESLLLSMNRIACCCFYTKKVRKKGRKEYGQLTGILVVVSCPFVSLS